jgi:predicted N-acetyltransferase YhbS
MSLRSVVKRKRSSLIGCVKTALAVVSLVAEGEGVILGHVLFSPVHVVEG